MLKNKTLPSLLSCLCLLTVAQVRANHVDFMTDGTFSQVGPGSVDGTGTAANILGMIRHVTLTGGSASLAAGGPLNFIAGAAGTMLTLGYGTPFSGGAFTANFVNPGTNNWNSIVVSLTSFSAGATGVLNLRVDSGGTQFSFAPQTVTGPGNYVFFYSQNVGGTINFQAINGVQASLTSNTAGASYSLAGVTRVNSIPEPSSVVLAILGGLGALVVLRRRTLSA
ncbi:MAG: PEP-CTERM sorting domain-containing protein [Verrucomicrobiota bacterium]|nr:PEP-CTERM sorting domain-containing protein [Verrucomicrobiota bacterium]